MSGDDLTEIYDEPTIGVRYVVRISRTAAGARTYTVGASLPEAYDGSKLEDDGHALSRLFAIENTVRYLLDHETDGTMPVPEDTPAPTITDSARRLLAITGLPGTDHADGWYTLDEMVEGTGANRSYLKELLAAMRKRGEVEMQRGGGRGRVTRYRLITARTARETRDGAPG
jgi:hypothetical protein